MNAKPVSISLSEELEREVRERMRTERMTRSEYMRKCIREEMDRARERSLTLRRAMSLQVA